jgi:AAA+ ATPase superfamily predicted ATPase
MTDDRLSFDDYEEVFTPGAPLELPTFFFGRQQELHDLHLALTRRGLHPIVIGNRGVGKTSLVHQALAKIDAPSAVVTCNSTMSFDSFARRALSLLGVSSDATEVVTEAERSVTGKGTPFGLGAETTGTTKTSTTQQGIASRTIDAWQFYEFLRDLKKKAIVVLDEYDVVKASNIKFHREVAECIKTLADNSRSCDSRLVVVGVSQSAASLLGTHESIERSSREVYLRPLRREDMFDFIGHAEEELGFQFSPAVRQALVENSGGYPYFVHLVGLECLDAMTNRDPGARVVEDIDFTNASRKAVQRAFRSELRKYREAIKRLSRGEIEILEELASVTRDRPVNRGWFLQHIVRLKDIPESLANDSLIRLQQDARLIYISRNKDELRFADPLMAPFLRIAIVPKGTPASEGQLSLFGEDTEGTAS